MSVIPALWRWRQEDHGSKPAWAIIVRHCFKSKTTTKIIEIKWDYVSFI
jgi:hypothetical protein